jgi:hypothetical protein
MKNELSREEQANLEVGITHVTKRTAFGATVFFLAVILMVPAIQGIKEGASLITGQTKEILPSFLDIYVSTYNSLKSFGKDKSGFVGNVMKTNQSLLDGIVVYEDGLENGSAFRNAVIPTSQMFFTGVFRLGNDKAIIGKDGWLFYEPGIHYLTSSDIENAPTVNRSSSKTNTIFIEKKTSAVDAVLDFGRQLQERGIELILVPAPIKSMFYPEKLSGSVKNTGGYMQNAYFDRFKAELEKESIEVFDAAAYIQANKASLHDPVFLKTDTHWSPEVVTLVAKGVADFTDKHSKLEKYNSVPLEISDKAIANRGDIANMLSLPETSAVMRPEETVIRQVLQNGNEPWTPDRNAEILFLGDSFSNIYSLSNMGWGESSGLVEQLSFFLDRPVDRIIQNDNGAYATRQALQYELSRGRDRLAGKKVVVWEFAIRELALGDWKKLSMKVSEPEPSAFFVPDEGSEITVTGVVLEASSRPVPKTTPYKDHIMTFHLVDVTVPGLPDKRFDALVYAFSMKDYELTEIASYRPGQKITIRLKSWFDVEEKYNSINRTEIDNGDLLIEDPCWGEEVVH